MELSRVGLGCNNFGGRLDFDRTRAVVDAALEAGVTHFDTADVYGNRGGSERLLGELLRGRRDRVTLATKVGNDMGDGEERRGAPAYVRRAFEASLERLQTDHVDLLYYHRPDGVTPIAETIGAMLELVAEGRARTIGVSNFNVSQLDEAVGVGEVFVLQNEYSLLRRRAERDVLPRCRELGVGFVPYFPLASGLLTGKYRRGEEAPAGTRLHGREIPPADYDAVEQLEAYAREHGHTLHDLAIAALASTPGVVSVIAGATSPEQVRANAAAAEWRLTPDQLAAIPS